MSTPTDNNPTSAPKFRDEWRARTSDASRAASTPQRDSPLNRFRNLIARGHWSVKHYGPTLGSLFLGAQEDLLKEHQLELGLAAGSAAALEGQTKGYAAKFAEFLANDGIIDPREAGILSRLLRPLTRTATTHATTLKRLAE